MPSKYERALEAYNGPRGNATVTHINHNIVSAYPTGYAELTGRQYGKVMAVANLSYKDGLQAAGAQVVDGDLVVIGDQTWPLAVLRSLVVLSETGVTFSEAGQLGGSPAKRGGDNSYYRKAGEDYVRISPEEAQHLLREVREMIYWQDHNTQTVVYFDGVEIARR